MYRLIITLILSLHLLMPIAAFAQAGMRNPLQISLSEYGLMLSVAILGGLVGWIRKVKSGDLPPWSLAQLIGEMVISAFGGLLTFWACTAIGLQLVVIAPLAGMAGLAGSKGLALAERYAQKFAERRLGLDSERGAP
jgi:hypothetical protein